VLTPETLPDIQRALGDAGPDEQLPRPHPDRLREREQIPPRGLVPLRNDEQLASRRVVARGPQERIGRIREVGHLG